MERKNYPLIVGACAVFLITGCAQTGIKSEGPLMKVEPVYRVQQPVGTAAGQYAIGRIDLGEGRYEAAIKRFRQALQLDPNFVEAHNGLGVAFGQTGRFAEAAEAFRAALASGPAAAHVLNNLGFAHLKAGQFDEAWGSLRRSHDLDPSNARTRENIALLAEARRLAGLREEPPVAAVAAAEPAAAPAPVVAPALAASPVPTVAPAPTAVTAPTDEIVAPQAAAPIVESMPAEITAAPIVESTPAEITAAPIVESTPVEITAAPIVESTPVQIAAVPIVQSTPVEIATAPIEEPAAPVVESAAVAQPLVEKPVAAPLAAAEPFAQPVQAAPAAVITAVAQASAAMALGEAPNPSAYEIVLSKTNESSLVQLSANLYELRRSETATVEVAAPLATPAVAPVVAAATSQQRSAKLAAPSSIFARASATVPFTAVTPKVAVTPVPMRSIVSRTATLPEVAFAVRPMVHRVAAGAKVLTPPAPAPARVALAAVDGLEVSNGVGLRSLAGRTARQLERFGVTVARVSDYQSFGKARTEVHYRAGHLEGAKAVQQRLPVQATLVQATSLHPGVNVRLVVGRDMVVGPIAWWSETPAVAESAMMAFAAPAAIEQPVAQAAPVGLAPAEESEPMAIAMPRGLDLKPFAGKVARANVDDGWREI